MRKNNLYDRSEREEDIVEAINTYINPSEHKLICRGKRKHRNLCAQGRVSTIMHGVRNIKYKVIRDLKTNIIIDPKYSENKTLRDK